jgi:hypothetical protein
VDDALAYLLRTAPSRGSIASLSAWFERLGACPYERPLDRALWAGFEADRLGFAFVGGYRAALDALISFAAGATGAATPLPALALRLSLAATESGGAHPRAIALSLTSHGDRLLLDGEKTFATLASIADELLVVASEGSSQNGKNSLRVVRVRTDAPGLTITDRAPTPFAPEIPHARLHFAGVAVAAADLLPGDGYSIYLKPFRTIEDVHVLAATLGYLLKVARAYEFRRSVVEDAFALAVGLRSAHLAGPLAPETHIALAGLFHQARQLISEHDGEWEKTDFDTRDRWRRDLGLLAVAEGARGQRTEAAWKALASRA